MVGFAFLFLLKSCDNGRHVFLDERFEYARKLKLCMSALRSAGERMGRYALAKRQAVVQEDFITAKLRKEQIEMYKNVVFAHLRVEVLMERDKVMHLASPVYMYYSEQKFKFQANQENDSFSEVYAQKPILPTPPSLQDVAATLVDLSSTLSPKMGHRDTASTDGSSISESHSASLSKTSVTQVDAPNSPQLMGRSPYRDSSTASSSRTGSLRRRNKSAPRNSYEDYEERAVPALRQ